MSILLGMLDTNFAAVSGFMWESKILSWPCAFPIAIPAFCAPELLLHYSLQVKENKNNIMVVWLVYYSPRNKTIKIHIYSFHIMQIKGSGTKHF